jgi:uncharacterized protein YjbI with pentapeptide repeats
MLRYILLSALALLLLTACGEGLTHQTVVSDPTRTNSADKSSPDLSKVSENKTGKAQAKGLLIEEFRCFPSKVSAFVGTAGGYGAKVRITNHGKTLNNVAVEVYALAGDKVEITSTRSSLQDFPNGITANFGTTGRYSNPSFIKFCDVRIVEREMAENMKDLKKEYLEGTNYKKHKFETVDGLEIPVPFKSIEIAETSHQGVGRDIGSLDLDNCSPPESAPPAFTMSQVQTLGCDLGGADLRGADLTGANLRDALLDGANLTGANLSDAVLTGANLGTAFLANADLTGANLTGAILSWADLTDANLDGVIGADFTGALNVPANYLKD